MKCIECEAEDADKASHLMEAAHCQKKQNKTAQFLLLANNAIDSYCLARRIGSAATLAKEIAEMLEEQFSYDEAAVYYQKLSDLYILDESTTNANTSLVKANDLKLLSRNFNELPNAIKVNNFS